MKLILGYSKTGQSVARYLEKHKEPFVVYDDKNPIALPSYDVVIKSPGVPLSHPLCQGKKILSEFDFFHPKARVIAITGTSGKSTLATLIYEFLKVSHVETALGGNIGAPVLDLPELSSKGVYVLELSSFQLEMQPTLPIDIAILLNFMPNHLDRHGTMEAYLEAKLHIFAHAKVGIVGQDLPIQSLRSQAFVIPTEDAQRRSGEIQLQMFAGSLRSEHSSSVEMTQLYKTSQDPRDILEKVAELLDLPKEGIDVVLNHFKGLEHRLEIVAKTDNAIYINDSKATTFFAVGYAIAKFQNWGDIHLIMGGGIKEYDASYLEPYLKNVAQLYIFGPNRFAIAEMLAPYKSADLFETLDDVMAHLKLAPSRMNVVLLSPGGTSYDLYKIYTERGEHFKRLVKAL